MKELPPLIFLFRYGGDSEGQGVPSTTEKNINSVCVCACVRACVRVCVCVCVCVLSGKLNKAKLLQGVWSGK